MLSKLPISRVEQWALLKLGGLVALLPLMSRQAIDPWGQIVPFEVWLMIVLIASIGMMGYFAVRWFGSRNGVIVTSVLGGLVSSTAIAIAMARMYAQSPRNPRTIAGAILLACALMFPRILLEVAVVNADLLQDLWLPIAGLGVLFAASAIVLIWRGDPIDANLQESLEPGKPFQWIPALSFGAFLVAVMLISHFVIEGIGEQGVWIIALISSISDVDAPTLAMSRMAVDKISNETAVVGIILVAGGNTFAKAAMVVIWGSKDLLRPMLWPLAIAVIWSSLVALSSW